MSEDSLLQRLKERKLVQWAIAYLAGAWVLFEVSDAVGGRWGLPDVIYQGLFILLAIGFFVALILAWYHGEKGRQRVSGPELLMITALFVIAGVALSTLERREGTTSGPPQREGDDRPHIAVLPLENMSPNREHDFFAGGVQEDLTAKLSRISTIGVKSRSSVERYRDIANRPPLTEIAADLGADYVLEGSVRISGDSVRTTVQLIEGESDLHVWTETFDAAYAPEDYVHVQAEIVQRIASELRATISPEDREWLEAVPTHNLKALEAYMRGVEQFRDERVRNRLASTFPSIESFEEAVRLDPGFALAHAHLAYARTHTRPDLRRLETAREAAERALRLADEIPEARLALDRYYQEKQNPEEAARQTKLAARVDPDHPLVIRRMATLQAENGAYDAAVATLQRGEDLDPGDPGHPASLAGLFKFLHRYDEALDASARHAASSSTPLWQAILARARVHLLRGELQEARAAAAEFRRSDLPTAPYSLFPNFTGTVVRRTMTAEERQEYFAAYTQRQGPQVHMACDSIYWGGCLRSAIHETEVGSAEKAQILWDSLRMVIETAPAPIPHYHYEYQALIYMQVGEDEKALDMARRAVERFAPDGCRGYPARYYNTCIMLMRVLAHSGAYDDAIDIVEEMLPAPSHLSVPLLELDPIYDPLRDHPRFQALLEKYADDVEH